ncbi:MAG: glycosyltransferase family 1 protein [Thermoanaerobaculia bacterium]|nr:glycosyltransferase family 1 protein [Thermoanaerobaculia bacterium]
MEENGGPASEPTERYSPPRRLLRALARRFPRAHIAFNFLRAKTIHYLLRARDLVRRPLAPRRLSATWRWLAAETTRFAALRREPRLTVAVEVGAFWEPLTGIGWYLYRLLEHLADRDDVRLRLHGPSIVASPDLPEPRVPPPTGAALELVRIEVPDGLVVPRGLLIKVLRKAEPLLIALEGNRVLFAPNYVLPRRFRLAGGARVATIHDLGWRKVPWTLRPETLVELSESLEHALFEATRLITVSETVRGELEELGLADPGRVTAIHHGPGQLAEVTPGELPDHVPESYGLHVGTLEPRKNILGLLAAWDRLHELVADPPTLVLCGRFGWKADAIRAAVERATAAGRAVHLGYVTEEELAALYRRARVVVFPSLYEGFGLPAIEAQQAGAPLVASDIPVLREVAADGALDAAPDRPDELAATIARLLAEPTLAREVAERGRRRAGELSWTRSARQTLEVLARAAGDAGARNGRAA